MDDSERIDIYSDWDMWQDGMFYQYAREAFPEIEALPRLAEALGDGASVADLVNMSWDDFNAAIYGVSKVGDSAETTLEQLQAGELLRYWKQKLTFLPEVADLAINDDWEGFSSRVQQIYETMPEAFELFYYYMPEQYRRDFVVGCYDNHGDAVKACRDALKELPKGGADVLPDDLRGRDVITVYRAGLEGIDDAPFSLSWTTARPVANFFYNRHNGGHVYKASLRTCDVIAYDDDRNEREALQYGDVYDVEEIEADPQEGHEWRQRLHDEEMAEINEILEARNNG